LSDERGHWQASSPDAEESPRRPAPRLAIWIALVVLLVIAGVGYWAWHRAGPGARRRTARLQVQGIQFLEQGRLKAAEDSLRAALALEPGNANVVGALTELLFTQGRRRELRELIWQVLPHASRQQKIQWLSMVWGSYHDDRLAEVFHRSRERLTRAIEVEPAYENRFGLAVTYLIRGRPEDLAAAQQLLEQCVRERPNDLDARLRLVQCLLEQQALSAAGALLDDVAPREPPEPELFRLRARLATARGRPEEALAVYRELVEVAPADVEAHLQLGLMLKRRGDDGQSRSHLDRYQWATGLMREAESLLPDLERGDGGPGVAAKCLRLSEITAAMGREREAEAWKDLGREWKPERFGSDRGSTAGGNQ
jgi:thioredoxin-like negative regulator of GroEL